MNRIVSFALLVFGLLVVPYGVHGQVISTFAGSYGVGPATNAELWSPMSLTLDASGNLYIGEGGHNIVRKINKTTGIATVFAATGCNESYGDNGPAVAAAVYLPSGLASDHSGNIFIADNESGRIRKVDVYGIITGIAGSGTQGFLGDGGIATAGELNMPAAVAADDAGNIYIADENNNRIRKVSSTGIITTIAGNGTPGYSGDGGIATNAQLHNPVGICLDGAGIIYVADMYNNAIRKITPSGIITTIAGNGTNSYTGDGGAATAATLFFPTSVFVSSSNEIYISDNQNNVIRKVNIAGIITTIVGTGTKGFSGDGGAATSATLRLPYGVTVDNLGNIFIADLGNNRVRIVNSEGIINTYAGPGTYTGDGAAAVKATLNRPQGVATDGLGNFYIADTYNSRIRKVDTRGLITTIAGTGVQGNTGDGGQATAAQFFYPYSIAADKLGNIYILDTNNAVRKINSAGIISTYAGNGSAGYNGDGIPAISASLNYPNAIAADATGNLYIADNGNNRIRKIDGAGVISTIVGTGVAGFSGDGAAATLAQINSPEGVAIDNHGNLYFGDYQNNRIRKVNSTGTIVTIAGTGFGGFESFNQPALSADIIVTAVCADNKGNVIFINGADDNLFMVDTAGILRHIAGNGSEDYGMCGENGIDSEADLSNPMAVITDSIGNIYFADEFNNRIRIIYTHTPAEIGAINSRDYQFDFYPNPAYSGITFDLPSTYTGGSVSIANLMGQEIWKQLLPGNQHKFDFNLDHIPSGTYIVILSLDNRLYRQKLVVIR